jgi:membrane-bound lytic murein transglycosylase F
MITQNNPITYYIYRDEPVGFEYELAKGFAGFLGVELEVITPGWNQMIDDLQNGKGDFIAASMTITPSRQERVNFSDSYMTVRQHVVTRSGQRGFNSIEDLNGKIVYVREGTSYQERLLELQSEGVNLYLEPMPDVPTEEFIRRVVDEQIPVTIADSNIALLNRRYYPDMRIAFPIAEEEFLGWAVRESDKELLEKINDFFATIRGNGFYQRIYDKYYNNIDVFEYVDVKKFHERIETRLPKYQPIIEKEADKHGFDWRLLAAIIYQESHFNPRARSYTGVRGLMQVTQQTAKEMGISNRMDPEQSVYAGTKYLSRMYERFDDMEDGLDRKLFALASYNVGYGHVRDAQKIALQEGLDPEKWSSLKETLPLLRYRKYYEKTRYGYARGTEPVRYVDRVMLYYDILRWKKEV